MWYVNRRKSGTCDYKESREFKGDFQLVFLSHSSTIKVGKFQINIFGDRDEYFHFRDRRPLRHLICHRFDAGEVPGEHKWKNPFRI